MHYAPVLTRTLGLMGDVRDIVDGRVEAPIAPAWCTGRGWAGFLCGLPDDVLTRCESRGLQSYIDDLGGAPPSLAALCHAVAEAIRLPAITPASLTRWGAGGESGAPDPLLRSVKERKRAQLRALLDACAPLAARAERIVDVGAGHGHLTRAAASRFARDALGVERDARRTARAGALAERDGIERARFEARDVLTAPAPLARGDLAIGLHACGEVGDWLVSEARRVGCDVALVSCCLQKISSPVRAPLSSAARGAQLSLARETLGLGNLGPRADSATPPTAARQARWAVRLMLSQRGIDLRPGDEMRGINRRRAERGVDALATAAFAARGLAPPQANEIAACEREAARQYGLVRRLSLPRSMLGRLVEVLVLLDRAAYLEESGWDVIAGELFTPSESPRNLAILARAPERLRGDSGHGGIGDR